MTAPWEEGQPSHNIFGETKWVSFKTRYVSATKEGAKQQALQRRSYPVRMCKNRLKAAEMRLRALENFDE